MRARHQEGWVEERGRKVKRWYGHYFVYVRDEAGKESRHHKGVLVGEKSKMCKADARSELRRIVEAH